MSMMIITIIFVTRVIITLRMMIITIILVTRVIITMRMVIITNIFLTRVIIRGLAAAADQRGDSVQLLGVVQDGRVEAIGQVLLVHCHQHFVKVYSPNHHQVHVVNFCNLGNVYSSPLVTIVLVVFVVVSKNTVLSPF